MSGRLNTNSTGAERNAGCSFAETFENNSKVTLNGGTVAGNPTIDFGGTFNGTSDYITYGAASEITTDDFSIVVRAKVDSVTDNYPRFFSSRTGTANGTAMYIENVAGGGSLACLLDDGTVAFYSSGGTNLADGAWHTLGLTFDRSGNVTYYVDGVSDGTPSDISARSGDISTTNTWRAADGGGSKLNGEIDYIKVFKGTLLTAQEHADYHNNSTYNYQNKAVLNLPLDMANHDPTNVRTLDVSGGGNNAEFGDGSTSSTYPTKLTDSHGYDFDGTADYLVASMGTDLNVGNTGSLTFKIEFSPDFDYDDNDVTYLYGSSAESIFAVIKQNNASNNDLDIWMGNEKIDSVVEATYSPYWKKGQRNVLIVSGTGGDGTSNVTQAWLNGVSIMNDTVEWYGGTTVATINIGSSYSPANYYDGKIHSFQVFPLAITKLQNEDILLNSNKKINDI